MCNGMSGGGSRTSSLTLGPSKSEEQEVRCLSPDTPLSFSKFSIETEWGEMEDFEDVAGGPLCHNGYNNNSSSQSWFDVRVMYVRVSGCGVSEDVPESLSMRFPSRSIGIAFEVNGGWISPSEEACVVLKRDRVDSENAEATFVSTDNLRMSGTVCFEVFNKEEALVSGILELSDKMWSMECRCVVGKSGCAFLKGSPASLLAPPAMEVSMVGRHLEIPVFITQTVHLIARRKMSRVLTLDVIPETEELGKSPNGMIPVGSSQLGQERDLFKDLDNSFPIMDLGDKLAAGLGYGLDGSLYALEGEDGQMTWFNAGVRVGVGIGLGMCLGAGIGIGLMIRTYQATTRTLRRVI